LGAVHQLLLFAELAGVGLAAGVVPVVAHRLLPAGVTLLGPLLARPHGEFLAGDVAEQPREVAGRREVVLAEPEVDGAGLENVLAHVLRVEAPPQPRVEVAADLHPDGGLVAAPQFRGRLGVAAPQPLQELGELLGLGHGVLLGREAGRPLGCNGARGGYPADSTHGPWRCGKSFGGALTPAKLACLAGRW